MPRQGYTSYSFSDADIKFFNEVRTAWRKEHGADMPVPSIPELCRLAVRYYAQRRGYVEVKDEKTTN